MILVGNLCGRPGDPGCDVALSSLSSLLLQDGGVGGNVNPGSNFIFGITTR